MTIISLMDDLCPKRGLRGEHGLSLLIEMEDSRVLLDTGQGGAFLENARFLGIDLAILTAVVLSHGHYDHGGGIGALYASRVDAPPLFAGRGFDMPRRAKSDAGLSDIGAPSLPPSIRSTEVAELRELAPDLFILPPAERLDASVPASRFRTITGGEDRLDEFEDELSLVALVKDGLVVITGCAHRGISNIARAALKAFPGRPLAALVGGFHLGDAFADELARASTALAELKPGAVYCSHCTAPRGFAALSAALPGRVFWLSCGMRITL